MNQNSRTPHDPLEELLAAAMHGELTAAQRTELDTLLQTDPAARAAYQETQAMHDLLERNHREAQPDASFEERLISGVRRKTRVKAAPKETAWESAVFLWRGLGTLLRKPSWKAYAGAMAIVLILAGVALGPITNGTRASKESLALMQQRSRQLEIADASSEKLARNLPDKDFSADHPALPTAEAPSTVAVSPITAPAVPSATSESMATTVAPAPMPASPSAGAAIDTLTVAAQPAPPAEGNPNAMGTSKLAHLNELRRDIVSRKIQLQSQLKEGFDSDHSAAVADKAALDQEKRELAMKSASTNAAAGAPAPEPSRKLVRDASLDLEVKSFQPTVDTITALARADGGYLDSSNSERGGNGKLQGTIVAKVLPENLDAFLLKLRDLGTTKNQSVSTEDVTKDYYDVQARLDNARRMEAQLQDLLARKTDKVKDLLEVERELGRVRGQIEQMQGQLKLYDFQVQYATVTINVAEKDLNQAAAYLLRETDQFSLFTGNVEDAFAQAKSAAEAFHAEILNADLQHDSDNTLNATMSFSVPPDQIDGFLAKVKALGRVDNFTRQTERVANDGGDPSEPSDQTRTEKDRVQVQLTIRADDESPRQQTQLAIASSGDVDMQAQQLKDDVAKSGAAVTASNFERSPDGTETATLSFRLALDKVGDFMPVLAKLGRIDSLTVQRHDRPDEPAADPGAPAEIDLRLYNLPVTRFADEPPRQQTQLAIASTGDVDAQAQQAKGDALKAGYTITASIFNRLPDGTEQAALTFRLPLTEAAAFTAALEKLGKVESLAVQRNDVTGPDSTDPHAPAEISLNLHSEPALVAEDRGFWPTARHLFGGAVEAFLGSVQMIGVIIACLLPWAAAVAVLAWGGRRIYVAYRSRTV